jgi:putative hydrolase of the HAD superfamily
MFDAVLFDLDGTLKISVPGGMEMFLEYARRLGVQISPDQAQEGARWNHWYWAQSQELLDDLALDDEMALWVNYSRRLLEAVGAAEADQAYAQAITQQFADYAPESRLNEGAKQTLEGLKAADYTVGLVSNRHKPLDKAVAELGLDGIFAFTLAAGEIDIWKPDPGIFHEVMAQTNLCPEQCIYVGDNYYADVVSARAAGLYPVLLDPKKIFPDADCKVISQLPELLDWLV